MIYQLCKTAFDNLDSAAPTVTVPDTAIPLAKAFFGSTLYLVYLTPVAPVDTAAAEKRYQEG